MRWLSLVLLALVPLGCASLRPARTPMPTILFPGPASDGTTLVVFLPGVRDAPEDFDRNGFVDILHELHPEIDAVAVDSHLGYYRRQTVLDRLEADVLGPARAEGRRIVLVGISLGGVGALLHQMHDQDETAVEEILVLAPFLGDDDLIDELHGSANLETWAESADPSRDRFETELWQQLIERDHDKQSLPLIYLAWGEDDDFAPACRLLATRLPEGRSLIVPGGHDWTAWQEAFETMLERGLLDSPAE